MECLNDGMKFIFIRRDTKNLRKFTFQSTSFTLENLKLENFFSSYDLTSKAELKAIKNIPFMQSSFIS
jgi:hypothetical protein